MSVLLVFLQQASGKLPKTTLATVDAAKQIAKVWNTGKLIGLTLGSGAKAAAESALKYGFEEVLCSEDPGLSTYIGPTYAQMIRKAVSESGATVIVAPATSVGKDCLPRVAAALEAGQASDITGVNADGSLKRPMYAGDIFADVRISTAIKIVTVRGTAFHPAAESGGAGKITELNFEAPAYPVGELVGHEESGGDRPELTDAEIVVSGGRALQSAENFQKYIFPLADALGAAVGASRAAVDSGYAPNDWQVGQTGKIVSPNLYVAVGISGAIQHLAGMKDSKVIVALNKDGEAPIFEVADYGLVADLYQAVPELTAAIVQAKGKH
ncbi:MAG: electron transfer flavoprotein subunit alpha/FixB family protein [Oligoflexia bacterium]|nr:electron transfer flavoprotein subunit alpha/FixB family protein [Oligoflexia bacterium]